jgi:hypothetical protein
MRSGSRILKRPIAGLTSGLRGTIACGAAVLTVTENEPETFEAPVALARVGKLGWQQKPVSA